MGSFHVTYIQQKIPCYMVCIACSRNTSPNGRMGITVREVQARWKIKPVWSTNKCSGRLELNERFVETRQATKNLAIRRPWVRIPVGSRIHLWIALSLQAFNTNKTFVIKGFLVSLYFTFNTHRKEAGEFLSTFVWLCDQAPSVGGVKEPWLSLLTLHRRDATSMDTAECTNPMLLLQTKAIRCVQQLNCTVVTSNITLPGKHSSSPPVVLQFCGHSQCGFA